MDILKLHPFYKGLDIDALRNLAKQYVAEFDVFE
jgi:hypothetical protein